MRIYLYDFEDSFTYNIYSLLKKLNCEVEVFHWSKIRELDISGSKQPLGIIYGPGPGHPDEYDIIDKINYLKSIDRVFQMGICLGHQLLAQSFGAKIVNASKVIHGSNEDLVLSEKWLSFFKVNEDLKIKVQRYNSLAVKYSFEDSRELNLYLNSCQECVMQENKNTFSIQFHPDSVGTNKPFLFFRPLIKFLERNNED